MRVLKAEDFLSLPEGVVFAQGKQWYFDGIAVKGETVVIDGRPRGFWYRQLDWIESDGTTGDDRDSLVRLDLMLYGGSSFPLDESYTKDLPVDEDTVFLVYEDADLDQLSAIALTAKGLF